MTDRRRFLAAAGAASLTAIAVPGPLRAHHGWQWAGDEEFSLSGTIRAARLGNPHGEIDVETAEAELWIAELGQPWRNAEAGLQDAMLAPGVEVTLEGHRSTDPDELLMKAERVIIAGATYVLYPDRS